MLPEQCCLKIIAVNDVYKIDQWPHFATCARKETESTQGNMKTISVLPGDFLAPSLLSSIDKGEGNKLRIFSLLSYYIRLQDTV